MSEEQLYDSGENPIQEVGPAAQLASSGTKYFVIRHQQTGFAIEATPLHWTRNVRVQHYTGFALQQWYHESAGNGKYFIINRGNGQYLDVENGIKVQANIITFPPNRNENQQWILNGDGTITTSRANLALDVFEGRRDPHTKLVAYVRHGKGNQIFHLQYL